MRILGISSFYHDGAAPLIEDGKIVAAAQGETGGSERRFGLVFAAVLRALRAERAQMPNLASRSAIHSRTCAR